MPPIKPAPFLSAAFLCISLPDKGYWNQELDAVYWPEKPLITSESSVVTVGAALSIIKEMTIMIRMAT